MKYLDFLYKETEYAQISAIHNDFLETKKVQHSIPLTFHYSYKYKTRGNRITSLTHSYTYNDLNQLTDSTTHTYSYDADGNLIEEKNKITTETKKYYYNSENRLIMYEHYPNDVTPADIVATYKYDNQGRRLQKNVNGTFINFPWEGDNLALELDANYQPIRRYVYGLGKDDVEGYVELSEVTGGMFDQSRQGWYSYIKDHVGTIYNVYSENGKQIIDTRPYDTFGNIINRVGTSTGNLGFQGKYYDQESGLYYFYNRYYNPANGRFINEDPIGFSGNDNFYSFVDNNPINNTDQFGLATFKNNCNRPIPYKPEETSGECQENKKYYCPPGATCDVDGVYPLNGGNPIKIADGCEAECKGGKLIIICRNIISRLYQRFFGGPRSDKWMNKEKNRNWPRPEDPVYPPCIANK